LLRDFNIRKTDIIKKRLLLSNKAVEVLRKCDRGRVRLPEVSKINLVVENSRKEGSSLL
jgi:hypothetical protein